MIGEKIEDWKKMKKSELIKPEDIPDILNSVSSIINPQDIELFALSLHFAESIKIFQRVFGYEWSEKNIRNDSPQKGSLEWYFKPEKNRNVPINIIFMANYIYNLCEKEGFEKRIERFKKQPIESLFFELHVADSIKRSFDLSFINESGKARMDFEFIIKNSDPYNCEVKYIQESSSFKTIKTKIKRASKQVPENTKNILFIKIPKKIFENDNLLKELKRCSSKNFGAIYFFSREIKKVGNGGGLFFKAKEFKNKSAYNPIREKVDFIKKLKDYNYQKIGNSFFPNNFLEINFS